MPYSGDIISSSISFRSRELIGGRSSSSDFLSLGVLLLTSWFVGVPGFAMFMEESAALWEDTSDADTPEERITRREGDLWGIFAGSTGTERSGRISPPSFCCIMRASASSIGPMFLRV